MKRHLIRPVPLALLALAAALPCLAEPADSPYAQQIDWFFSLLKGGRIDDAAEGIYANNPSAKAAPDQIAALKSALRDGPGSLGDFLSDERLAEDRLGSRFVHLDYVVNFERRPVRMFFEFYRSKDGWQAQAVGLMDDIPDWSKERARAAYVSSGDH